MLAVIGLRAREHVNTKMRYIGRVYLPVCMARYLLREPADCASWKSYPTLHDLPVGTHRPEPHPVLLTAHLWLLHTQAETMRDASGFCDVP